MPRPVFNLARAVQTSHSAIAVEPVTLDLPTLPPALDGLRVAHITDLHVQRRRRRHDKLLARLREQRLDLVLMSGDYMTRPGDEPAALAVLQHLTESLEATHGIFGIFGNHDSRRLREQCRTLPVRWLINERHRLDAVPLELWGHSMLDSERADSATMVLADRQATGFNSLIGEAHSLTTRTEEASESPSSHASSPTPAPLRLMPAHRPESLLIAADLGLDLMLAGHTHGGQCRLPGRGGGRPLMNSATFPLSLTAGAFRHRGTLGVIARGAGEHMLPLRTFCPAHVPIYTLQRGAMPKKPTASDAIEPLWLW